MSEQKTQEKQANNTGGVFITPKNADKQEFVRKTTKYWVHADDIPEMKRIILAAGIPEYKFSDKITNLVQSLYLGTFFFLLFFSGCALNSTFIVGWSPRQLRQLSSFVFRFEFSR